MINTEKTTIAVIDTRKIGWKEMAKIDNDYHAFMLKAKEQKSIYSIEQFIADFNSCMLNPQYHKIALSVDNYFELKSLNP